MAWKKTEGKTGTPQLPEGVAQVALGSHESVAQMALGSCLGPTFSLSLQAITLGNKPLII